MIEKKYFRWKHNGKRDYVIVVDKPTIDVDVQAHKGEKQ